MKPTLYTLELSNQFFFFLGGVGLFFCDLFSSVKHSEGHGDSPSELSYSENAGQNFNCFF